MDIIFVHGFLGAPYDFKELIKGLTPNITPHIIDLNNTPLNTYSLRDFAEYISSDYCRKNQISKALFWGYSMGGRILLELYMSKPELFQGLILESVNPGLAHNEALRKERLQKDLKWAELIQQDYPLFLEKWYSQELFSSFKNSPNYLKTLKQRELNSPKLMAQIILESSPSVSPSYYELLDNISVPCLALLGEKDLKYTDLWQKRFEKNKNLDIKLIPQAGHVIHLENPIKLKEVFHDFCRNNLNL